MLGKEQNGYVRYHMLHDASQPLYVRHSFMTNPVMITKKTPAKFKSPTHQSYPQSLPCFNISLPYRHILHFKTMDNFRFDIITSFIVMIVIKSTLDDLALSNTKKWIPSYYLPKEKNQCILTTDHYWLCKGECLYWKELGHITEQGVISQGLNHFFPFWTSF